MTRTNGSVVREPGNGRRRPVESLWFLAKFLRSPTEVASVWPSSRHLARSMLAGVKLDRGDVVLEYGPGTGAFTADIASLVEAGKGSRYLGIEADADFYHHLRQQFPRLAFSLASVEEELVRLELPQENSVKAVISGLPLTRMPAETIDLILERTSSLLAPDGVFRAFYYVYSSILPGAFHLRRRLKEVFPRSHISFPVIRNVPPAMVVSGWKS